MELGRLGRSALPLSNAEKARRRKEGLCLYCGLAGHFAQQCPNKRQVVAALRLNPSLPSSSSQPSSAQPLPVYPDGYDSALSEGPSLGQGPYSDGSAVDHDVLDDINSERGF